MSRQSFAFARWDSLVNGLLGTRLIPPHLRWRVLRLIGMDVRPSIIASKCFFGGRNISIGEGSAINVGAFLDGAAPITIGEKVAFGPDVMIITSTHDIGGPSKRAGRTDVLPVTIGAGSWLGARVTVMPGVTIGEGCMIASGAVVTKDCKPNGLYAGVPAVRKFDLPTDEHERRAAARA